MSRSQRIFLIGISALLVLILVLGCTPNKQGGFTCALVPVLNKVKSLLPSSHKQTEQEPIAISRPTDPAPVINSFDASPSSINSGEKSTLEWDVSGAMSVIISPDVGSVSTKGVRAVSPKKDTVYTLTASNASSKTNQTVSITVTEPEASDEPAYEPMKPPPAPSHPSSSQSTTMTVNPPGEGEDTGSSPFPVESSAPSGSPPVISVLSASPSSVTSGSCTTVSWMVSRATTVTIYPGGGSVPSSGSGQACPSSTTTFVLTASNSYGSVQRSCTVTVSGPPPPSNPPVIGNFTANPTGISAGGCSTLSWSTSGATSVTVNPGGAVSGTGSAQACPSGTTTYTLTATNSAGSVTRTATVTVAAAPPPPTPPPPTPPPPTPPATPPVINSFTASPASVAAGSCSTLSWSTSGATSATVTPGGGSVSVTGNAQACPAGTTTYTLTATNSAGSVTRTASVTVTAAPPPTPPPPADTAGCEQALFNAVNARRAADGKAALTRNSYIDGLCRQHAQYMANQNNLSHDNFDSRSNSIKANIAGIHACGENVLQNNMPCDATAMATQWFNSPPHKTNMLKAAYTLSGMGIVVDSNGKIWACQIFAGP